MEAYLYIIHSRIKFFLANLRKEENISVTINLTRFISYEAVVRQSIYL